MPLGADIAKKYVIYYIITLLCNFSTLQQFLKKLEPIWNQVSQSLYPPVVRVAQVDCTRFPNVASEFKVKGFPTLILYNHLFLTLF